MLSLLLLLGLAGCGSTSGSYTLTATPAMVSLTAGSTAQISVAAIPTGNYHSTVAVAVSGLPAGVTASPTSLSLTPGTAQTLTLAAPSATAVTQATVTQATVTLTGTAGSMVRSATVSLALASPPPPADFSLTVTPATQTLTAGGSSTQVSLLATAVNGFSANVAVAPSGLPPGVTASPAALNLTPGTSQSISLAAATSTAPGTVTVTFTGTSGALSHTASLGLTIAAASTVPANANPDVTTYHYDNTRQGLNAQETALTLANVNSTSFGLLGLYPVDGKVDAQPLYLGNVKLPSGTANVVYVATENDSVYALNAATGAQAWKTSVLGSGETTSDDHGCGQITPQIGITSTPIIDRSYGAHGAVFVVGMTKDTSGAYHQRLHALDLTTGAELSNSPAEIKATYPGTGAGSQNGQVPFNPAQYAERAALLLLNGTIYMAWTSHCDNAPYTGWIMGYSESSLQQSTVLNLTPNGTDGSIWMSGYGLAADTTGNIYFLDANGTFDTSFHSDGFPSQNDFGNAMLKLSTSGGLAVSDFFEPNNTDAESSEDKDLGSGGAMLLPDLADQGGTVHHLLVGAGKDGNIYVGNRDNLGRYNSANNSSLYQEIAGALPSGAWSGPAYFNNTVYYAGVSDVLKAYSISNAMLSSTPASQSATNFAYPGSTPSVSANGTQDGIVWALESGTGAPAVLHAYDAANLAHELYNSSQAANGRDGFGNGNKFLTPMVANGMVFVGTQNSVAVFGLLHP